jgi:hypothetical protein
MKRNPGQGDHVNRRATQRTVLGLAPASFTALGSALLMLAVACAVQVGGSASLEPVPPQEWQEQRGPVVPHETFPSDCALCHEGSDWHTIRADFRFDHAAQAGLPLEGAHARAECLRCHNDRGPVESFARRGCAGCHEDVHLGRLGADCAGCHTQDDWRVRDAIAKHARTRFPLVGAHVAAACWSCHPGAQVGRFELPGFACIDCHASDLGRALNPDHQANDWTSGCERCHAPVAWQGASFSHTAFPINSGAHSGIACSSCHPTSTYSTFTCTNCHAHTQREMADEHDDVSGYVYQSSACYGCHPQGSKRR